MIAGIYVRTSTVKQGRGRDLPGNPGGGSPAEGNRTGLPSLRRIHLARHGVGRKHGQSGRKPDAPSRAEPRGGHGDCL